MEWGGPFFVIAIVAISTGAWLLNNWVRAKHGYPLENEWGGMTKPKDDTAKAELQRENAALRGELEAVNARVAVLERIVTDKGYGLSERIEALRGNGQTQSLPDGRKRETTES